MTVVNYERRRYPMNDLIIKSYIKLSQTRASLKKFVTSEKGVTAIEYAVVVAGVAAVVMVVFGANGTVSQLLTTIFTTLKEKVDALWTVPATPTPAS